MRAPHTEVGFPADVDPGDRRPRGKGQGSPSSVLMAFCTPLSKLTSGVLSFLQEAGLAQRAEGSGERAPSVNQAPWVGLQALPPPGTQSDDFNLFPRLNHGPNICPHVTGLIGERNGDGKCLQRRWAPRTCSIDAG